MLLADYWGPVSSGASRAKEAPISGPTEHFGRVIAELMVGGWHRRTPRALDWHAGRSNLYGLANDGCKCEVRIEATGNDSIFAQP